MKWLVLSGKTDTYRQSVKLVPKRGSEGEWWGTLDFQDAEAVRCVEVGAGIQYLRSWVAAADTENSSFRQGR